MSAAFAKEPWKAKPVYGEGQIIGYRIYPPSEPGQADVAIAEVYVTGPVAKLIAAAPELHRDLVTALALVRVKYGNLDEGVNEFIARAEATLTKVSS